MKIATIIVILFIAISSILLILPSKIPHPRVENTGIAINPEIKKCTTYWEGNEFIKQELPKGWQVYYSNTNEETIIGNCIQGSPECNEFQYQCTFDDINLTIPECVNPDPHTNHCERMCKANILKTDVGDCYYTNFGPFGSVEHCCNQLADFNYIDHHNVIQRSYTKLTYKKTLQNLNQYNKS